MPTTYAQDIEKAMQDRLRWKRKLMLARTKMRKLNARITRLSKLLAAGTAKKPRRGPLRPLNVALPLGHTPLPMTGDE